MSEPLSEERLNEILARAQPPKWAGEDLIKQCEETHAIVAEVRRLRELLKHANWRIAELCESNLDLAFDERDAARADLARAIELLRCITETPTPIPGVTLGDYHEHVAAFLAEMGKR